MFGTPDIGDISGETTPYKEIKLFEILELVVQQEMVIKLVLQRSCSRTFQGAIGSTGAEHKLFYLIFKCLHK